MIPLELTLPRGVQRPHVKDVDALHLAENLETLKTGGLLQVGRHGAGLGAGADEVVFRLDVCEGEACPSAIVVQPISLMHPPSIYSFSQMCRRRDLSLPPIA